VKLCLLQLRCSLFSSENVLYEITSHDFCFQVIVVIFKLSSIVNNYEDYIFGAFFVSSDLNRTLEAEFRSTLGKS